MTYGMADTCDTEVDIGCYRAYSMLMVLLSMRLPILGRFLCGMELQQMKSLSSISEEYAGYTSNSGMID